MNSELMTALSLLDASSLYKMSLKREEFLGGKEMQKAKGWVACWEDDEGSVGCLILCVTLVRFRDARIAGTTLFLGVFGRVLQEEISIWIIDWIKRSLASVSGHHASLWGRVNLISAFEPNISLLLPLDICTLGSQAFDFGLELCHWLS